MTYAVKCDSCRFEYRRTDSVRESAEGGYCTTCRVEIAEENYSRHQRDNYGPLWNENDEAEAERLSAILRAAYDDAGTSEIDRIVGI